MERRRWLVVGTDFSPPAARALLRAAALAKELGTGIACVHAYDDVPGIAHQSDPGDALRVRLAELASRVKARFPTVAVECFLRRGAPWEKLVNVACELGAEMIVVGRYAATTCAAGSPRSCRMMPSGRIQTAPNIVPYSRGIGVPFGNCDDPDLRRTSAPRPARPARTDPATAGEVRYTWRARLVRQT